MKKLIGLLILLSFTGIGIFFAQRSMEPSAIREVVVYQSRSCGCCKKWIQHLELNGFKASSNYVDDVTDTKLNMKLPMKLASCHTAVIDGYIIEGHVPAAAIEKLLSERPKIKGLAVPGMPIGSPGMEQGSHKESFDVVAFDEDGNPSVFMNF